MSSIINSCPINAVTKSHIANTTIIKKETKPMIAFSFTSLSSKNKSINFLFGGANCFLAASASAFSSSVYSRAIILPPLRCTPWSFTSYWYICSDGSSYSQLIICNGFLQLWSATIQAGKRCRASQESI